MGICDTCGHDVDRADNPAARWDHMARYGHDPDACPAADPDARAPEAAAGPTIAFYAGEAFREDTKYAVVGIQRDEPGHWVVSLHGSLEDAVWEAHVVNVTRGIDPDTAAEIRASSAAMQAGGLPRAAREASAR